jgi:hypothetical protein
MAGALKRNDFKSNHHFALACCLSIFRKTGVHFRDHALMQLKENAAPEAIGAAG